MARLSVARFEIGGVWRGMGVAAALMLGLSACEMLKEQAGLTKKVPDEFTVITKPPLVMPPYFSLRPPRPGARGPQEIQPSERARTALFSSGRGDGAKAEPSAAEAALLRKAGALGADSSIRQLINRETSVLAEKNSSFADRLLFWQAKQPVGSAVDAGKEARRLREAAAAGEAPSKGETPIIKRRKRGWLEGIF